MGRVLIVEDEILVALDIEDVVSEMGFNPVGIAADTAAARRLGPQADIALVDLNLRDGLTGIDIGRHLASDHNLSVVFLTANPAQLGKGVPGTVGVITKPADPQTVVNSLRYAADRRAGRASEPPKGLLLFNS